MPVEATDVDTPFEPQTADADQQDAQSPVELPVETPQSPKKKQGRPAGSKDKAPRRRPVRAEPRPVTRRSVSLRKTTKREFRTARFAADVHTLEDLRPGMTLEGAVTNVAAFGAFVDVGVHQDGLVHISELADRYVKDPRDVVRAGQIVQVRVLDIDVARRRIALSMRTDRAAGQPGQEASQQGQSRTQPPNKPGAERNRGKSAERERGKTVEPPRGTLGAALADALRKR